MLFDSSSLWSDLSSSSIYFYPRDCWALLGDLFWLGGARCYFLLCLTFPGHISVQRRWNRSQTSASEHRAAQQKLFAKLTYDCAYYYFFNTAGAQAARDDDEWRGRSMSFKSSLKRHTPSSCLLTVFKVALLLHITPRLLWTKAVHQAYTSGFSQCLINSWLTKCEMCVRINSCTIKSCTDMEGLAFLIQIVMWPKWPGSLT